MIANLICAGVLAPMPLELKVVTASLFKNGYAVIVREASVRSSGQYSIEEIPAAVLGTMWVTASPGVKLRELVATMQESESESPTESMDEVLALNTGKTFTFWLVDKTQLSGKIESAAGSLIIIQSAMETRIFPKSLVQQISSTDSQIIWKAKRKSSKRVIRFTAETGAPGKLFIVSLERGLTWAPSYAIDISDPAKLELTSKAVILDDIVDLNNIEVRLITGFPNVPFIGYFDPFAIAQSVDQFTSSLMQMGTASDYRRDAGIALKQNAAPMGSFDNAFAPNVLPGFTAEDLFFYRQPNVQLKRGDRGYYVLFTFESSYQHIYEWDIPDRINETTYVNRDDQAGDVWHSIKFTNSSKQPLTTAPATIFKNGEIMGQDMMRYTSAGADATVKMTKALDVRAEDAEEEISRVRNDTQIRGSYYDIVTLKGTLRVQNRKSEAIKLRISKELTGEVLSADGNPTKTNIVKGLRAVNPRQRLVWTIQMKPADKQVLTYTYKVFINR